MNKFTAFFYSRRNLYLLGLLAALGVSFSDVMRGRHLNFLAFANSTLDFWRGITPYTLEWADAHLRYFLYAPPFSVLFTPFAFMPPWLGPFAWNVFNYTLFFTAVFTLPGRFFDHRNKCRIFLFTLPILAQSLLSFQYTVTVASIFLFAWSLLERGHAFRAVLLIMISGMTKIYGIFELALLLCYPRFWRNLGYVALTGAAIFLLPLAKLAPAELLPYYGEWIGILQIHQTATVFDSLFYAAPFSEWMLANFRALQIGSLLLLAVLVFASRRKWDTAAFRAQALGILMGWVILFSDSAEKNTYLVAMAGFMLWYRSRGGARPAGQDPPLDAVRPLLHRPHRRRMPRSGDALHHPDTLDPHLDLHIRLAQDGLAHVPAAGRGVPLRRGGAARGGAPEGAAGRPARHRVPLLQPC